MSAYTFVSPLPGAKITSGFAKGRIPPKGGGKPRRHEGLDLDAETGDPVRAIGPGIVAKVVSGRVPPRSQAEIDATCASSSLRAGNYVEIDHPDGYRSRYLHLGTVRVREGQRVQAGELVGTVGLTGCITGSHLHFEILEGGTPVNPLLLVDVRNEGWRPHRIANGSGGWVYRQFEDGTVEVVETPNGQGVGMRFFPSRSADARALAAIEAEIGPYRADDAPEWSRPARAVAMELQDDVRTTADDALTSLTLSTNRVRHRADDILTTLAPRVAPAMDAGVVAVGAAGAVSLGFVGYRMLQQHLQQRPPMRPMGAANRRTW